MAAREPTGSYTCPRCGITQNLFGDDDKPQLESCGQPWVEMTHYGEPGTGFCWDDDCSHGEECHPPPAPVAARPRRWWQFWLPHQAGEQQ
jgi:hypothetical protein